MRIIFLAVTIILVCASALTSQVTALRFGKICDGTGKVWDGGTILVEKDRIVRVAGKAEVPAGASVVDLSKYTAIPGLIDVHTHMMFYWDKTLHTTPWAAVDSLRPAMIVFLTQENARKTLEAGVTTVRDLSALNYSDLAMRDLINRGSITGPRMFVSGCALYATNEAPGPGYASLNCGMADGVAEVLRTVRQQVAAGADVIKMFPSTGSDQDVTGYQTTSRPTRRAIRAGVANCHGFRRGVHYVWPKHP